MGTVTLEITTFRFAGRSKRRFVEAHAAEAVRLVRGCKSGRWPHARIVLTTMDGLQAVGLESIARAAGVPRSGDSAPLLLASPGTAPYACTVVASHGVDILIAVEEAERVVGLGAVLLHEPVHALQISDAPAREAEIRQLRHDFGVESMSAAALRRSRRRLAADEREAQRIEHRLLKQTRGWAS